MKADFIINPDDKFYPGHHMWTYCTFLGKFTDSEGTTYDLGIHIRGDVTPDSPLKYSEATVYGNEAWEYISGYLHPIFTEPLSDTWIGAERIREVIRRAKLLNLMK